MRNSAIEDGHALDARFERIDAGLHFGNQAARWCRGDQRARRRGELLHQLVGLAARPARRSARAAASFERRRSANVSALTLYVPPRPGRGRDGTGMSSRPGICASTVMPTFGFAGVAEVDHSLDVGAGIDHGAEQLFASTVAPSCRSGYRLAAGLVDETDEVLAIEPARHHFDDLDRRRGRDAQPRRPT